MLLWQYPIPRVWKESCTAELFFYDSVIMKDKHDSFINRFLNKIQFSFQLYCNKALLNWVP